MTILSTAVSKGEMFESKTQQAVKSVTAVLSSLGVAWFAHGDTVVLLCCVPRRALVIFI